MRLKLRAALFASLVSSGFAAPAGAVQGGAEDRQTTFAVSIIEGGPSVPQMHCSGTLISPNVVLTVRHCVTTSSSSLDRCDIDLGPADRTLWVGATPWVSADATWRKVSAIVVPEPRGLCGNDVALLVLEEPFTDAQASPARVVTSAEGFRASVKARVLGLSGFGALDPSGAGMGTRRLRRDVPVNCVPGQPGFACKNELDYIDAREFTAGDGPCSGDSGAGAISAEDSALVFGVLSRGKLAERCAEGVFERTDVWSWLLAKTVLDASPNAGSAAPAWASTLFPNAPREGDFCRDTPACGADAECASLDGQRSWTCVATCSATRACGGGKRCENGLCVARAAATSDDEGCRVASSPSDGAAPVTWLVTIACVASFLRARRRA